MEAITIYPKNKKQASLFKSLLKEMKVDFEIEKEEDDSLMTKEEFYAKIDESIKEAEEGKAKRLTPELLKELFGDVL